MEPGGGAPRPSIQTGSSARSTSRLHDHDLALADIHRLRIVRMHLDVGGGHRPIELRNAACHRTGMPMFEHTPGAQPQRIRLVGHLRRLADSRGTKSGRVRLRSSSDRTRSALPSATKGSSEPDETEFRFTPRTIFLLHDGPAEASRFHILFVRSEVLVLQRGELPVLFKKGLVDVDIVVVFPFPNRYFFSVYRL